MGNENSVLVCFCCWKITMPYIVKNYIVKNYIIQNHIVKNYIWKKLCLT